MVETVKGNRCRFLQLLSSLLCTGYLLDVFTVCTEDTAHFQVESLLVIHVCVRDKRFFL